MICDSGNIVIVPFPFVDAPQTKRRPALVLSKPSFNKEHMHTLLAMITTGGGTAWKSDVPISDCEKQKLHPKSTIRMKLFTLDNRFILKRIGNANRSDWMKVKSTLSEEVLGE